MDRFGDWRGGSAGDDRHDGCAPAAGLAESACRGVPVHMSSVRCRGAGLSARYRVDPNSGRRAVRACRVVLDPHDLWFSLWRRRARSQVVT